MAGLTGNAVAEVTNCSFGSSMLSQSGYIATAEHSTPSLNR